MNHCTAPVGHSAHGAAPSRTILLQSNFRSSVFISAGNGAKITVDSAHWYLLQLCLLHKNPPVVPPVIHLYQTVRGLSIPGTKTQAGGKICFRTTGNPVFEGGTGRAAQGWQAAALPITQLRSLGEGRSEVEVASVSPSRSGINPVAFLEKQKSECVTSAMSPKFLLTIRQNERAIQSPWSYCA